MQFSFRCAMLLKLLGSFFLRVELQHFSSPRRNIFVSAENVTCHRGDNFSSPRREKFLSTVNREKLWSRHDGRNNNIHVTRVVEIFMAIRGEFVVIYVQKKTSAIMIWFNTNCRKQPHKPLGRWPRAVAISRGKAMFINIHSAYLVRACIMRFSFLAWQGNV